MSNAERRKVLSVTIHDCEVQTFRCGGNGGQNVNKRDTGVRIIHHPSGARAEGREERQQLQNKKLAWKKLVTSPQFQLWLRRTLGQEAVREVELDERLSREVKIEVRKGGRWTQVSAADLQA